MTLPDDWTMEQEGNLLYIDRRPAGGSVTINLKERIFCGGIRGGSWPSISNTTYEGRGWRARLIADAVAWLEAQP